MVANARKPTRRLCLVVRQLVWAYLPDPALAVCVPREVGGRAAQK